MQPRTTRTSILSAGLVLVAVVSFAACSAGGASPEPSAPPTAVPSVAPTPAPTAAPTPAPATPTPVPSAPADGAYTFDLDVADDHAGSVVLTDASDRITAATSGKAGDGMSVRWSDIEVVNVDRDTLRVTFVGYPQDEVIGLGFDVAAGDGFNLVVSQRLPLPNTDALGADRVVILDFEGDVDASDVYATFVAS